MAYSTVSLTGTFTRPDATPAEGWITIRASRSALIDPDGDVILSGRVKAELDSAGSFSVDLPATDDPGLGEPFTYSVSVALRGAHWSVRGLVLPAAVGTFDLADVPDENTVRYMTAPDVEEAIDDALTDYATSVDVVNAFSAYEPVTISTTPPSSGLWVNPEEEA